MPQCRPRSKHKPAGVPRLTLAHAGGQGLHPHPFLDMGILQDDGPEGYWHATPALGHSRCVVLFFLPPSTALKVISDRFDEGKGWHGNGKVARARASLDEVRTHRTGTCLLSLDLPHVCLYHISGFRDRKECAQSNAHTLRWQGAPLPKLLRPPSRALSLTNARGRSSCGVKVSPAFYQAQLGARSSPRSPGVQTHQNFPSLAQSSRNSGTPTLLTHLINLSCRWVY